MCAMEVTSFLHRQTQTYTHVLADTQHQVCAIIDPVLDYDFKSGHTSTDSAEEVADFVRQQGLSVRYIIETHVHADHLSSAQYLKQQLGGQIVIGHQITRVQQIFKEVFNLDLAFKTDASQFDKLTKEGSQLLLGDIELTAMHVPGHTPADMAYIARQTASDTGIDNRDNSDIPLVIFVGDTLFAPDVGTARCDFPGGDAHQLYHSIQKILSLPDNTQIYLCHDYPPEGRTHSAMTTVADQKQHNIHVKQGISEAEFVKMRTQRDATLQMPTLIIPSVQVNIRAGNMPEPEDNGVRYLKVPLNTLR